MNSRRLLEAVVLLALAAGCGGSQLSKFETMPGAPRAVWSLGFMPSGAPAVLGGLDTFGAKQLMRQRPDDKGVWEPAARGPQVATAGMFRRGSKLYLGEDRAMWRLDDEASFTWSLIAVPYGATPIGVDDTDRYYGISNRGVFVWVDGSPTWSPLPRSGFEEAMQHAVVDAEGNVYWSSLPYGISRANVLGSSRVVDCAAPEYGQCQGLLSFLTLDGAGNLYFIANGYVYRLRKGTTTVDKLTKTPITYPYNHQLQAMADGTLFLTTALNNLAGTDWAIFRLARGDSEFEQITADDRENFVTVTQPDRQYMVSDDAQTIYGFGDGNFALGVIRGTL